MSSLCTPFLLFKLRVSGSGLIDRQHPKDSPKSIGLPLEASPYFWGFWRVFHFEPHSYSPMFFLHLKWKKPCKNSKDSLDVTLEVHVGPTLPETRQFAPENGWFLKMIFRFGIPYSQRRTVSFRECPFFFCWWTLSGTWNICLYMCFQLEDSKSLYRTAPNEPTGQKADCPLCRRKIRAVARCGKKTWRFS